MKFSYALNFNPAWRCAKCVYRLFCLVLFIKISLTNLINLGTGILIAFTESYNWLSNSIKTKELHKYKWLLCQQASK